MSKKKSHAKRIANRKVRYDYALDQEFIAGLALTGRETKSLRLGHAQIKGSYVIIRGGEVWLVNAQITGSPNIPIEDKQQRRDRKLLLKKPEIKKITEAKRQGGSIVPLEILTGGRYIKIKIALGHGKKKYDKRSTIKRREQEREARREVKR